MLSVEADDPLPLNTADYDEDYLDDEDDEAMGGSNGSKKLDKRRQWSKEDDLVILKFVRECGTKRWSKISELLPGRTPKQCRTRCAI